MKASRKASVWGCIVSRRVLREEGRNFGDMSTSSFQSGFVPRVTRSEGIQFRRGRGKMCGVRVSSFGLDCPWQGR